MITGHRSLLGRMQILTEHVGFCPELACEVSTSQASVLLGCEQSLVNFRLHERVHIAIAQDAALDLGGTWSGGRRRDVLAAGRHLLVVDDFSRCSVLDRRKGWRSARVAVTSRVLMAAVRS